MNIIPTLYSILLSIQLNFWCRETNKELAVHYGEHQETFKKGGFFYPEVFVANENVIIVRSALSSRAIVIQNFYIFNLEENKGKKLNYTTLYTNNYITKYENTFRLFENHQLKETTSEIALLEHWIVTKLKLQE